MASTPSKPARWARTAAARCCSTISGISSVSSPVRRRPGEAFRGHDADARVRPVGRNDGGRDRLRSGHRDVRRAARVEELGEHVAALGVNRVGDASPAGGVLIAEERGRPGVAAAERRDRRRLGDDQPAFRRPLAVILHHQIAWDAGLLMGPQPTQRRHDYAVLERDRPDSHRREQLPLCISKHRYPQINIQVQHRLAMALAAARGDRSIVALDVALAPSGVQPLGPGPLRKDFDRILFESVHRVDVRNRAVADARHAEPRQPPVRRHTVHDHDVDRQPRLAQILPMSASSWRPGMKRPEAPAPAYAFARARASPTEFAGSPSGPRNRSVRALMKRSMPFFSAAARMAAIQRACFSIG